MRTITLTTLLIALAGTFAFGQSRVPEKIYTYSVKLTSTAAYTDSYSKENFQLTGNWERLVIKVGDVEGILIETPEKAPGRIEGIWHYESLQSNERCIGNAPFSAAALAELGGWHSNKDETMSHVVFNGNADEIRKPEEPCPNTTFVNLWSKGSWKKLNADGLEVVSNSTAGASFLRTGGAGFFFPLEQLRDGKSFTVKGSDTFTSPDYTYTWELELVFTPGRATPPTDTKAPQGKCALYDKKRCEDLRKATWDYDELLRKLNRLPTSDVVKKVTEILKLIDELKPQCEVLKYVDELAAIKRDLEDWMRKHKNVQPRLDESSIEGKAIWKRLYDLTDKICKPCCGGIGPEPANARNPR
jgi:hypothetical protein